MGHITTAIIKIEAKANAEIGMHLNRKYLYLVTSTATNYKFWEFKSLAFNGRFRRDHLQSKLTKQFGIEFNYTNVNFGNRVNREYISDEQPAMTYLSIEIINNAVKERIDEYYKEIEVNGEWLTKEEVKAKHKSWIDHQKFIIEESKAELTPVPPSFPNNFKFLIERIQDANKNDKLVAFVGSGVSNNSGVPFWGQLIDFIKDRVDIPEYENDYLIIPQLFHNEVGESQYNESIKKILKHKKTSPNVIHQELLKLKPIHIITTNYDDLIEQSIEKSYKSYSIIKKDKDLPTANTSNYLIKMHGDFDESNMVLKEDDYLNYSNKFPLIENFVKGIFSSYTVLFIGFSFSDINLKYILERVKSSLKTDFKPAILFTDETIEDASPQKVNYFKNRGIQILNYNKAIKTYLNNLGEWKDTGLNPKGQKVLDFIKFLKKYDRHIDQEANTHIVDKMYNALKRFDELNSIPPNIIEKLPPFALSKKDSDIADYNPIGFHFKTMNERIVAFVSKLSTKDGQLEFDGKNFEIKEKHEKDEDIVSTNKLNLKLKYIFNSLNSSGIFCLQRANDQLRSNHFKIRMPNNESCSCPKCLLTSLSLDISLERLYNGSTECSTEDCDLIANSLNIAFTYYYFGDYIQTYKELKKASIACLKKGWFTKFFLIQHNTSKLKYRIKGLFNTTEIDPEYKAEILSEIGDINLNDLLADLPIDNLVKETLEELITKKWYQNTARIMRHQLEEEKKLFKQLEKGGGRMGSDPYDTIYYEYTVLNSFYVSNFLFDVYWQDLSEITYLFWDATLYAYRINDNNYRIDSIQNYMFNKAIFHISPKKLSNLFLEHNNPLLNSNKEQKDLILTSCMNFFNSNHMTTTFFKKRVVPKKNLEIQKKKCRHFEYRIRELFGCILIFLAHYDLSQIGDGKRNRLLHSILDYICVEKDSWTFDAEYLIEFLDRHISLFEKDTINKIIQTLVSDHIWSDKLLESFFNILDNKGIKFKISEESILESIYTRSNKRENYNTPLNKFSFIKKHLTKDLKKSFEKQIEEFK